MSLFRGCGILLGIVSVCAVTWAADDVRSFGKGASISHYFPQPHLSPEQMPDFQHDEPQTVDEHLDQFNWTFINALYDAETLHVELMDAVPTGILLFPSDLRAYISTYHTVFYSNNWGISWQNGDVRPPPGSGSLFSPLRRPSYVYGLAPFSSDPAYLSRDTIYVAVLHSQAYLGYVRLVNFVNLTSPSATSPPQLVTPYWLGHLVLPDTAHITVLGSWDGLVSHYRRRDMDSTWKQMSLNDLDGWVTGPMAYTDGRIYLAGSSQWVSFDGGLHWRTHPSADEIFDGGAAFVDPLCGWTGGGRISPVSEGWVHRTTDAGLTWSGRLLETNYPIRTVHFLDRNYGFAAGGNYQEGIGGIWSTTDGGETWHEDLSVGAEITVLGSRRYSVARMDVFAAGFYPDFIGGVWRSRILYPDTSGAVLIALPDTLDFGEILLGERDTLSFWTINLGSDSIRVQGFYSTDTVFKALPDAFIYDLAPEDSVEVPVQFHPLSIQTYTATITVFNTENQTAQLICRGEGRESAAESSSFLLPQEPSISVFPNPGNPDFSITFNLPAHSDIRLSVHNVLGQRVASLASGWYEAGSHQIGWQARDLPSGIYFVCLDGIPSPKIVKLFLVR